MYTPAGPQGYTPNSLSPSESTLRTSHATSEYSQSSHGSPNDANMPVDRPGSTTSQAAEQPLFNPYYHQYQGPGINTVSHLSHNSAQVPRHIPPYPTSSDPTYTWHGDGTESGYRALYPPQTRPGWSGGSFADHPAESLHASMARIVAEVKGLATRVTHLSEREAECSKKIDEILTRFQGIEAQMSELDGAVGGGNGMQGRKSNRSRGASSEHPLLKPVVHTMFFQMCGVEESGSKGKRTGDLCGVAPLETGAPFEIIEEREVWHPMWKGKIDDGVNVQFIKAAADRIWENEQRIRSAHNGRGEISDNDFTMSAITDCVKTYWRNVHKQFLLRRDPERYSKTLDAVRLRGRRQGHTNTRKQAARDFCEDMDIPLNDAMAMLDTDYASEAQTCGSDTEASDSTADRRAKAGLGQMTKKVVGFEWRSPDYVAFLRWLTFKSFKGRVTDVEREPDGLPDGPVRKRRRITTKASKAFKKEFDPSPSTLLNRPPSSQKCTPFKSMVADWWLESHPDAKTIGRAAWLVGFYGRLKEEEDLHLIDSEYLKELAAWHKEKESVE